MYVKYVAEMLKNIAFCKLVLPLINSVYGRYLAIGPLIGFS